jgi:hypothetical protein
MEAVTLVVTPVIAEVRAYRAEVDAQRAELRAIVARLELKFEEHDRDIAALHRHLFGEDDA